MNEIDYHNAQEAIGIGQEIQAIVANYCGLPENATEERIDRAIYKGTDCGAWFKFTETGVRVGSIVEGSDAEFMEDLNYPFTEQDFSNLVERINDQACEAWHEANEDDMEGTEGQDRDSYTDTQDRESYQV